MIRTVAIWTNWVVVALFFVAMLATSQINTLGAASLFPLLPYASALANYHLQPNLPMVWTSLGLNVLFCVISGIALIAVFLGKTDRPIVAALGILLLVALPCAFNVRNMLRIRVSLKGNHV
jgi:hypothetical protein